MTDLFLTGTLLWSVDGKFRFEFKAGRSASTPLLTEGPGCISLGVVLIAPTNEEVTAMETPSLVIWGSANAGTRPPRWQDLVKDHAMCIQEPGVNSLGIAHC